MTVMICASWIQKDTDTKELVKDRSKAKIDQRFGQWISAGSQRRLVAGEWSPKRTQEMCVNDRKADKVMLYVLSDNYYHE